MCKYVCLCGNTEPADTTRITITFVYLLSKYFNKKTFLNSKKIKNLLNERKICKNAVVSDKIEADTEEIFDYVLASRNFEKKLNHIICLVDLNKVTTQREINDLINKEKDNDALLSIVLINYEDKHIKLYAWLTNIYVSFYIFTVSKKEMKGLKYERVIDNKTPLEMWEARLSKILNYPCKKIENRS